MIIRIKSPLQLAHNWPALRTGYKWLADHAKYVFREEEMFRQLAFLAAEPSKAFIAVCYNDDQELLSFIVAVDATPVFESEKICHISALLHLPHQINITRRLLNALEVWALANDIQRYSLASKKFGRSSINLFTRLGFKKDSLILTKEL